MFALALASLALLVAGARGVFIELSPHAPACFLRSVEAGEAVTISYELNTPELMAGSRRPASRPQPGRLEVLDLANRTVLDTPVSGKGSAVFTPAEQGNYSVCFSASSQRARDVDRLRFSFRGLDEKEKEREEALRGAAENTVRKLVSKTKTIRSQQVQVEKRYDTFERKISSSVRLVSILSCLTVAGYFGLTVWQIRALKRYFVRQKI